MSVKANLNSLKTENQVQNYNKRKNGIHVSCFKSKTKFSWPSNQDVNLVPSRIAVLEKFRKLM